MLTSQGRPRQGPQRHLNTCKQFLKVNGGQTLSGEVSDRISTAQDVNGDSCSEDVFFLPSLSCRVSIFSPFQAPASMPGLQTSSPVAFHFVCCLAPGRNKFPNANWENPQSTEACRIGMEPRPVSIPSSLPPTKVPVP